MHTPIVTSLRPLLVATTVALSTALPANADPTPAPAPSAAPAPPPAPAPAAAEAPAPPTPAAPSNVTGTVKTDPASAAGSAVVYIEGAPLDPAAVAAAGPTITNKSMKFNPFLAVIPQGGTIIFRNDDPFPHNVNSPDGEKFNMGSLAMGQAKSRVFKNAGVYSIRCNLHPTMLSYVVVTPSTYYARVDSKGAFTIKGVPAGTYKVTAWAPGTKPDTQPITLSGTDVAVTFDLHH